MAISFRDNWPPTSSAVKSFVEPDVHGSDLAEIRDDMIARFSGQRDKARPGGDDLAGQQRQIQARQLVDQPDEGYARVAQHVRADALMLFIGRPAERGR